MMLSSYNIYRRKKGAGNVMDKFALLMQDVIKMSPGDQNKAIEEYKGSCVCSTCPTLNECAEEPMKSFSV